MDKIEDLICAAGGVSALAVELGVKPPTVSQWRSGVRPIPARLALAAQAKWPLVASVHDLRPDVFGAPAANDDARKGKRKRAA